MSLIAKAANVRPVLIFIQICLIVAVVFGQSSSRSKARSTPTGTKSPGNNSAAPPTNTSVPIQSPTVAASANSPAPGGGDSARGENVRWTDIGVFVAMIVGILLQLTVSAVGFGFLWYQVRLLRSQVRLVRIQIQQLNRGIQGETHSRLYEHYLKVTERLANQPKLRPYFYGSKELKEDAPGFADLREEIDMMSEIIAGLLEHAAVQRENLPKDSWEACWRAYTHERFQKSLELRKFFRENHVWYAESFCDVIAEKYPHLIRACSCTIDVAAANADCPTSNMTAPADTTTAERQSETK